MHTHPYRSLHAFLLLAMMLVNVLWAIPAQATQDKELRLLRGEFARIQKQAEDDSKLAILTFSDQFGPAAFHIAKLLGSFLDINHPVPQFLIDYAGNSPHPDMPVAIAQYYFEGTEGLEINPQKSLYWSFRAMQLEEQPNLPVLYQMVSKLAVEAPDANTQALDYSGKCIAARPDSADCFTYRGLAYNKANKTAEAMKDFYTAQRLGGAEAAMQIAQHAMKMGNLEEAEVMGRTAAFRGYHEAFAIMAHLHSIRYERDKNNKDARLAVVWAQQGIKEGCKACYISLASMMLKAGYETEAEQVFEAGAKSQDPQLLQSAAEFYIKKHNVEDALVYIDLLQTCQNRANDVPKAMVQYQQKHWAKLNAYRQSKIKERVASLSLPVQSTQANP